MSKDALLDGDRLVACTTFDVWCASDVGFNMRDARRLDVSDRTVALSIDLLVGTAVALLACFQ